MQTDITTSLPPDATLRNALDIAEEATDVAFGITHFRFKGNTYVYVDQADTQSGYTPGDFVVRLDGEITLGSVNFFVS